MLNNRSLVRFWNEFLGKMRDKDILNFCISFVLRAGDIRSGSYKIGIWVDHIEGISVVFVLFPLSQDARAV